ncbi:MULTISPECIES: hypothetical protein [unclassified Amycolatopsis]|uniref:hypothetical protein n=1 Tax=unclassified Amycolatopsis TaxID=2618356 RepID=UPI00345552F5
MTHPTDDELRLIDRPEGHLAECPACHRRWDSWRSLTAATRQAALVLTPELAPPSFDTLLPDLVSGADAVLPDLTLASHAPGPDLAPASDAQGRDLAPESGSRLPNLAAASDALPPEAATPHRPRASALPNAAPRPAPRRSLRTSALLVWWQLRLMPRRLLPLSFVGLAAAVGIALITPDPLPASRYFAAGVVLVALLGSLATISRRGDPRGELLFALPTSPVTVFIARLVVVLTVDLLLALAGSVAVHAAGIGSGVFDLVTGWLGQSLLASAIAVAGTVRWSSGVGAAAAVAAWCLGSLTTLARGGLAERIGAAAAQIWGTTPWTLALVLLLFVLAARQLRLPERRREFA